MPIKADIKILPTLSNLELTKVTAFGDSSQEKHYHDQLSFAIVTKGAGKFRFRDSYHRVSKGAIIKINPGEVHSSGKAINQRHLEYRVFYLSNALLHHILDAEEQKPVSEVDFKEQISYNNGFFVNCLETHLKLNNETDLLNIESLFTQLILALVHNNPHTKLRLPIIDTRPSYLSTVIDYLNAYYNEAISLKQLSNVANRSPSQVLRTFQKYIGVAPHAYLTNLRIIKAKALLNQHMSISQTALEVGFNDQSHFHRHFKRITHVTPGRFIKSLSI
ncbi:hypothetical protein BKI52_02220 [marine bacterium AO1-C]|nr:hypothetical protein BKI52_02220 [marine bacterium AO1-C]